MVFVASLGPGCRGLLRGLELHGSAGVGVPAVEERRLVDMDWLRSLSLKALAWRYGCAPKGSEEERVFGVLVVERIMDAPRDPEERYEELTK